MNTEKENTTVSKAQQEVWEWKEKAWKDLQSVPKEKRMQYIKENTQAVVDEILSKKKSNSEKY